MVLFLASSKTNGVQIDAKKSIIGADFVGVINQLFLNPGTLRSHLSWKWIVDLYVV